MPTHDNSCSITRYGNVRDMFDDLRYNSGKNNVNKYISLYYVTSKYSTGILTNRSCRKPIEKSRETFVCVFEEKLAMLYWYP